MSEDEKREGEERREAPAVPPPPKLNLDAPPKNEAAPAEEKAEPVAEEKPAEAEPAETKPDEPERESRRKRRKRPEDSAPAEKAELVTADVPAKSKVVAASEPEAAPSKDADRMDLPKWNRARVKRKQPEGQEDDAFQAGVRKAGQQAVRRAPLVLGLIVLVAAGIAGVVWYQGHRAEKDAEATRILASAAAVQARAEVKPEGWKNESKLPFPIPLLDEEAERAQQTEKGLAELHDAAEGSKADLAADLMRAAQQVKDGKFADAIASYTTFLDKNPEHELTFLAREGKALALEANNDIDGALAELDTLAGAKGAFYRDQALAQKARILEAAGRKDEAIAVYEQYAEEYPLTEESFAKAEVLERLRELKPELVPEDEPGAGGLQLPPGLMPP